MQRRIIAGFGLDWSNENAKIDFDTYCNIKCFLEFHTLEDKELLKIWSKILNPQSLAICTKEEMIDLFERFSRGRMLDNPTLISMTFAKHMIQLFEMEGCMIDADRVDMAKLRHKIEDQTFDTSLFN